MSIIRPYGDTTGDGMVQLSFTLPVPHDKRAEGAAVQLANKMGMDPALVVHAKAIGPDFTFFVVYGPVNHLVDTSKVEVVERDYPLLSPKEVNLAIRKTLRRRALGPLVVRDRERERHLHHAVAGRVAVRADNARRGLGGARDLGSHVLHVLHLRHRVSPVSSRSLAGL